MHQFDDRPDWSAEERFVNRSIRMRRHALLWMDKNKGRHWNEVMKVAEECLKDVKDLDTIADDEDKYEEVVDAMAELQEVWRNADEVFDDLKKAIGDNAKKK